MLWALWTGKEASYKALQKEWGEISSAPRRYKVRYTQKTTPESGTLLLSGVVSTPAGDIQLSTLITSNYVHSIAASSLPAAGIVWNIECMIGECPSPQEESAYVRTAAISCLAQYLALAPADIEIIRPQTRRGLGPPQVYVRRRQAADIDISLSHDGAFAAYVFTIAP